MKIFLTGKPGVGKTTVLKKFLENFEGKIVGFFTPEIRKGSQRIGFEIVEIPSGKRWLFASVEQIGDKRFGKYWLNLEVLENVVEKIEKSEVDLIVIDEIGKMEMFCPKFREFIEKLLKSEKCIVATLHREYAKEFNKYGKVIEVTKENRDELPRAILKLLEKNKEI
jgi:nucleoside-triphosphatase